MAESFDRLRLELYTPEDREKKSIETTNRQGEKKRVPLMTLSIAIVSSETRRILHYGRKLDRCSV
jgi:hypothetical protein